MKALAVGLAYYAGAELAFWVGTLSYFFAPLWPPNVILFCALLQAPYRRWWLYVAAALPAHAAAELGVGMQAPALLGAFASNVALALGAAAGLRRFSPGPPWLDTLAKAWTFILVSALGAPTLVSLGIALVAWLSGDRVGSQHFAIRWGLANVLGGIALAPVLVTWIGEGTAWLRQISLARAMEAAVLGALLVGTAYIGFPKAAAEYPVLACLPIPLMLWATVRFGPRGAAAAIFLMSLMALGGAIAGRAPFAASSPEHTILSLQTFLAVLSAPFLVLAAVIAERRRATVEATLAHDELQAILDNTPASVCVTNLEGRPILLNRSARASLLTPQAEARQVVLPDTADSWRVEDRKVVTEGKPITTEERIDQADGSHLYLKTKFALRDGDGAVYAVGAVSTDITDLERAKHEVQDLSARLLSAQDEERRRIARELHDSTGQSVTAVLINLQRLTDGDALPDGTRHALEDSTAILDHVNVDIRTLSYLLHPPLLDEIGLAPALRWYVEGFRKRSNIAVRLLVSPEFGRLERDAEIALFRIVQEALTNVYRHSGSKTAEIDLTRSPDAVILTVSDSGCGIAGNTMSAKRDGTLGVGVAGMRARLKQLGGSLEIQSSVRGTVVSAILPRTRPASASLPQA